MDQEDKMERPDQPVAAVGSEAATAAGPAGSPKAAASTASKSQPSAEKVQPVQPQAPQPVQQSASSQRQPREAEEAPAAVRERRSNASQQVQQQRPLARESAATAATADKQSVATSKTESKLFLVSASTASVVGSAAPVPVADVAEPKPSGRASAASGLDGFTRPSGSLLMRGPRSRSAMSFRRPSSSRGSIASRNSRGTAIVDYGLSPGLQSLIGRLTNTKDVGLIAYLSAIPGEPHGATRPPAAINKLQQKQSGRPKSIMKISKATVRFEPTYRLEPLRPFRVDRALDQVKKALEMGMAEATYSPQWATDAVRILAAYITQCVKAVEMPAPNHGSRYKIATMVTVLERRQQGVRTEGAVLWDDNLDRIISACVENNTMVACAVVYAVFWE